MKVTFDKNLYTEDAIKKAYSEMLNSEINKIMKSSKEYIVELPKEFSDEELHHFESMVLLYTIEDKRR